MKGWGTPPLVAAYVGRKPATIREWAYRLRIPVACEVKTRRLVVHAGAARAYSERAGYRRTRRQTARAGQRSAA